MPGWNYRVFKKKYDNISGDVEYTYTIKGAFYNNNGEVDSWTKDPEMPYGHSKDELLEDLQNMMKAMERPVLDEDELELKYSGKYRPNPDILKTFEEIKKYYNNEKEILLNASSGNRDPNTN